MELRRVLQSIAAQGVRAQNQAAPASTNDAGRTGPAALHQTRDEAGAVVAFQKPVAQGPPRGTSSVGSLQPDEQPTLAMAATMPKAGLGPPRAPSPSMAPGVGTMPAPPGVGPSPPVTSRPAFAGVSSVAPHCPDPLTLAAGVPR